MKTVVVTGGIATGKTTASEFFQQCVPETVFFDCDAVVHDLLTKKAIKEKVKAEFGDAIFTAEGEVDRSLLGGVVFADAEKRKNLEGVLHPEVLKRCLREREEAKKAGKAPVFLADVPLYYEVDFPVDVDEVLVIAATRETRLRRLRERGRLDAGTAERLISIQMPLEEKIQRADCVIWNEGQLSVLRKQVHYAAVIGVESYGQ